MSEKEQLIAMLDRSGIGYGRREDYLTGSESIQVESPEEDERGRNWVAEFSFCPDGLLIKGNGVCAYQDRAS